MTMKRFLTLFFFVNLLSLHSITLANPPASSYDTAHAFIKDIFKENTEYVNNLSSSDFKLFKNTQRPRATIVACSDSRFQSHVFHNDAINDLFFIRNIGNQIATTQGSVEYGIYHLHTPVLLIVGHVNCGAIHAAMGDYSNELLPIQKELDHLHLAKNSTVEKNVVENVHQQVAFALNKFKDKMDKKELVVVGALYDFRDDYHQGHGRLILINLNGEKDPKKFKNNTLLKGVDIHTLPLK